ncbi:sensor histidine kinase [Streptomyces sp. NPDC048231]|uniref:sensor histidine kinase n=1 Tax=Streptomyces sp. NPDC048231 TaxID=3365519 RepID=UPI00371F0F5F
MGGAVGLRRDLTTAAQAQLATLEREQELLVQRTRVEERSRIARDMHDVVAHRVGHIVLTAGALRVGAAAHEPKIADAAELIRREGRHALEELREILGILTPGRRAPRAPRPDADELSGLVERCRRTGQLISLCVEGFPEALPTVVQQALLSHASGGAHQRRQARSRRVRGRRSALSGRRCAPDGLQRSGHPVT